jgi:hypothetical protein
VRAHVRAWCAVRACVQDDQGPMSQVQGSRRLPDRCPPATRARACVRACVCAGMLRPTAVLWRLRRGQPRSRRTPMSRHNNLVGAWRAWRVRACGRGAEAGAEPLNPICEKPRPSMHVDPSLVVGDHEPTWSSQRIRYGSRVAARPDNPQI